MLLFMKKKIVMVVVELIISHLSFSQQATRPYIDSLLNLSDSNYRHKTDVLFVINGISYDANQVDTVISKYDQKYLADAMFLSREKQSLFYRDVAVVVFASRQKTRESADNGKKQKNSLATQIILFRSY